jgi:hypothetical protein
LIGTETVAAFTNAGLEGQSLGGRFPDDLTRAIYASCVDHMPHADHPLGVAGMPSSSTSIAASTTGVRRS